MACFGPFPTSQPRTVCGFGHKAKHGQTTVTYDYMTFLYLNCLLTKHELVLIRPFFPTKLSQLLYFLSFCTPKECNTHKDIHATGRANIESNSDSSAIFPYPTSAEKTTHTRTTRAASFVYQNPCMPHRSARIGPSLRRSWCRTPRSTTWATWPSARWAPSPTPPARRRKCPRTERGRGRTRADQLGRPGGIGWGTSTRIPDQKWTKMVHLTRSFAGKEVKTC